MFSTSYEFRSPRDESELPGIPPTHEPEPDDPEPDEETQELVRPVKT